MSQKNMPLLLKPIWHFLNAEGFKGLEALESLMEYIPDDVILILDGKTR